jgi:hypothetical protein
MAGTRRLGPWLLGLYLIAQIFGVAPLVGGHAAHVAGNHGVLVVLDVDTGGGAMPQDHHQPGNADGADQHHALQDLNGVLASTVDRHAIAQVRVVAHIRAPNALVAADPVLLERPPKSRLSV